MCDNARARRPARLARMPAPPVDATDQILESIEALSKSFNDIRTEFSEQLGKIQTDVQNVQQQTDQKLAGINKKLDDKFTQIDNKFTRIDNKFTRIDNKLDNKFSELNQKLDDKFEEFRIDILHVHTLLARGDDRAETVEQRLDESGVVPKLGHVNKKRRIH